MSLNSYHSDIFFANKVTECRIELRLSALRGSGSSLLIASERRDFNHSSLT